MYEKQPFIGEVHELVVEFGDDILTFFPIFFAVGGQIDRVILTHPPPACRKVLSYCTISRHLGHFWREAKSPFLP